MPDEKNIGEPANKIAIQSLEATINKSTKEVSLKDSSGQVLTIKANVIEEEEEEEKFQPLTPDQFRLALETLSSLGLTWTADRIPRVVAKDDGGEKAFLSDEYQGLQQTYPNLPRELSAVVFHALTGAPAYDSIVGTPDELKEKVSVVRNLLLTATYRSEFFFKFALKVPYFEEIDWEVVFKTHERNVEGMPAAAYALLMLTFHNPNSNVSAGNSHQNTTVAVNLRLVNKLISTLVDIKTGLEDAQKLADRVTEGTKDTKDHAGNE